MIMLPIVDRELRVAARDRATYRWRIVIAVSSVVLCGAIALVSSVNHGAFTTQLGRMIFGALKWGGLIFACFAGVFLTADCLSEEKREGTLGLLFLTDLRGHDVALGKLLATSLRGAYSLLAMFPAMALAFILGGVPAEEFRHTFLAICNALFFSLALGMMISAGSREPHKAINCTLALIALFMVALPALDTWISWLSPAFSFLEAGSFRSGDFWFSALLVQLESWCFLAAASWLAPRRWQDDARTTTSRARYRLAWLESWRERSRLRWLERNPIGWLTSRDRWASNAAGWTVIVSLGLFVLSLLLYQPSPAPSAAVLAPPASPGFKVSVATNSRRANRPGFSGTVTTSFTFMGASWMASALTMVLGLWIAFHVSRFYVEGKKSGFLELLLVTPMTPEEIVNGHWLGLRRLFLAPVIALLSLQVTVGVMQMLAMNSMIGASGVLGPGVVRILMIVLGMASWITGLIAIVAFSMWMGATSNKIMTSVLKTYVFVKILPVFGASVGMGLLAFVIVQASGPSFFWIITAIPAVLIIVIDLILIRIARRRMRNGFRGFLNPPDRPQPAEAPRPPVLPVKPPPLRHPFR